MHQTNETPTSPDTILTGAFWPGPVRVIRVEPIGTTRIQIEAVSLDGEERLITLVLKRADLAHVRNQVRTVLRDPARRTVHRDQRNPGARSVPVAEPPRPAVAGGGDRTGA